MKKYILFLILGLFAQTTLASEEGIADPSLLDLGVREKEQARKTISFFEKGISSKAKSLWALRAYQVSEVFESYSTKSVGFSSSYLDECLESFRHNNNKRKLIRKQVGGISYFYDEQTLRDVSRITYILDGKMFERVVSEDQEEARRLSCEKFLRDVVMAMRISGTLNPRQIQRVIRMADQAFTADVVAYLMKLQKETVLIPQAVSNVLFKIDSKKGTLNFKQVYSLCDPSTTESVVFASVDILFDFKKNHTSLRSFNSLSSKALIALDEDLALLK